MDPSKTLSLIKKLIGEGNIEQALEQLVSLLDSDAKYAELAHVARVNQGEYYQIKAQILKNTISQEDARLANNQLADSTLQVVRRLEAGKLTFKDTQPAHSRWRIWRYYIVGGVVALVAAFLIWWFLKEDECPKYAGDAKYRVMILPFRQTGSLKDFEPEFEIVDGLNTLIAKTPYLKAGADVNEYYDINKNYPSFAEAGEIGGGCDVQMIVWGKIRKSSEADYKLDVFYKLLDANGVAVTGDTTLSKLLKTRQEGQQLTYDVTAVTNHLYIVLANQARVPVLAGLIEMPPLPTKSSGATTSDTSWMLTTLALAENYKNNKQEDKAIETYSRVLETFPDNEEARLKRGALSYQQGDFATAALDLEYVVPETKTDTRDLLKIRADALLKSGNVAKAMEDLKELPPAGVSEDKWVADKIQEARDTMKALQKRLDKYESSVKEKPKDTKTQLEAARTSVKLGRYDKAINYADKVLKDNPKSEAAYEIKVETNLAKGDTMEAKKTIETAEKHGVKTPPIGNWRPAVLVKPDLRKKSNR